MVVSAAAFIVVDWGTTNRRAYAIGHDGGVIETVRDANGVLSVARDAYAGEVAAMRARLGDVPVLCAGMVGSTRGWAEVPYVPCPAGIDDLVAKTLWVEPGRTAIVPGVSAGGARSDVMRGEEVQLLGAVAAGLAPPDALLCQPGTHCKWARMEGGRIADFRTTMTGEVFALLRHHSLLGDFLKGDVVDGPAFRDGVAMAGENTLLSDLFGERAAVLTGRRDAADVASRVSGLLIGSDVREQALRPGEPVHILADPALGQLYASAVAAMAAQPIVIDSHAAFLAGITAIWDKIHDR
ncbi:2-dehydro-3-deoxygalactonokinase [Sphingomonas immobilis]|uniref:2-dehydro-3-deoxygalactonokinase n=1 Tax=Sphingomonas immobilis TaxID=3063997 RepID=A0ABT8ZU23_9SPHN|nr:2-dehydro-3-deoxygalactonokinase [Sphingomonas sp. CA1-15]MDO7840768.1 2-dehydro-3-deoxygalactonokinase [Sphingomonas sp. CA1-15]